MRERKFNDSVKGPKAIKKALDTKPIRPLTAVVRDIEGPNGQPKGSVTCDPQEVDAITRRAWGRVTKGNNKNKNQLIHKFFREYAEYIYVNKEFEVQPLTGHSLKSLLRRK